MLLEGTNELLVPYAETARKTLVISGALQLRTAATGLQIMGITLAQKAQPICLPSKDHALVDQIVYSKIGTIDAVVLSGLTQLTLKNKQTLLVSGTVHFTPDGYPTGELTLSGENNRYTVADQVLTLTDTVICDATGAVKSLTLAGPTPVTLPDDTTLSVTIFDEITLTPSGGFTTVHAATPVPKTILGQTILIKDLTYDDHGSLQEMIYNLPTAQTIPGYGTIQAYKVKLLPTEYVFESLQLPEFDLASQDPRLIRITTTRQGEFVSQESPNQ
jgi:hypothetical protein